VLERQRIANEYDAVERRCNQAPEISRAVLDTWGRVESMQTQESRLLLDQELEMISKKATRLINQAFRKTLTDRGTSLEDMGVGHGTRGASVSMLYYPGWATDTERVDRSCNLAVSSWGMEISVVNYKNPLLRKLE